MIFLGADGENYKNLNELNSKVCAIKFYLNETFSNLKINNISILRQYFIHCPDNMLMCFHAEVEMVGVVLYLASIFKKRVHICMRDQHDGYYSDNMLMYVLLHEIINPSLHL